MRASTAFLVGSAFFFVAAATYLAAGMWVTSAIWFFDALMYLALSFYFRKHTHVWETDFDLGESAEQLGHETEIDE